MGLPRKAPKVTHSRPPPISGIVHPSILRVQISPCWISRMVMRMCWCIFLMRKYYEALWMLFAVACCVANGLWPDRSGSHRCSESTGVSCLNTLQPPPVTPTPPAEQLWRPPPFSILLTTDGVWMMIHFSTTNKICSVCIRLSYLASGFVFRDVV